MKDEDIRKGKAGTVMDLDGTRQTETCPGATPEGYADLFIFAPEMRQVIRISEGTGDNLFWEDKEKGYVDYIYYGQHELSTDMPVVDGGRCSWRECSENCSNVRQSAYRGCWTWHMEKINRLGLLH